jgi:hypothetical protein
MPQTFDEDDQMFVPSAAITNLTDGFGTADGTVADVTTGFVQGTLNDNFQEMSTKINAILAALRAANVIAED